jgi:hypothetical protein
MIIDETKSDRFFGFVQATKVYKVVTWLPRWGVTGAAGTSYRAN